jgi:hypothetical protein
MIKLFFLLPLLMCLFWWFYINSKGYSIKETWKSFSYIIAFNMIVILFFVSMMFITH